MTDKSANKANDFKRKLGDIFDRDIVFIVGATRWGTAWVQQCCDAHGEICAKGEGHFTDILFPRMAAVIDEYNTEAEKIGTRLQAAGLPGTAAGFTFEDVDCLLATAVGLMFKRWSDGEDVKCIMEKTPEHVLSLGVLERIIPNLKIVHVVRDGRDEAVSAWNFNQKISSTGFSKKFPTFNGYSDVFSKNWARSVSTARRFGRANPKRYFQVRAEDIQTNPAPEIQKLFTFLKVDADPKVARDCMDQAWDVSPLDVDSGVWKQKFDDAGERMFMRNCGELLKLLDYQI